MSKIILGQAQWPQPAFDPTWRQWISFGGISESLQGIDTSSCRLFQVWSTQKHVEPLKINDGFVCKQMKGEPTITCSERQSFVGVSFCLPMRLIHLNDTMLYESSGWRFQDQKPESLYLCLCLGLTL